MIKDPMVLLLADDDPDDCIFFKFALDEIQQPTQLTAVHDGEQLMSLLSKADYQLPNVLFLDLNMPRKSGFECLSDIRLNKDLADLPIIIFSTSYEHEVVNVLYSNGVKYFIRKPAEFKDLKTIIEIALKLISEGNLSQPSRENFVLSVPSKSQTTKQPSDAN